MYNGYVKCDSFYDDMRNYFNHKGELTIDHADGNVINNTINNLSLMIINNNRKKGNITSKLKLPEKLIIAYDSNGYLFEITMIINRYENLKALLPPHMNPNTPYTWLKRFCEKEHISYKGLHRFRHAFATQAIVNGKADIKSVSAVLGHSKVSTTTDIYTHAIQSANAVTV